MTFLGLFVLSFLLTAPAVAHDGYGSNREPVTAEQEKDFAALMTKGKLAADLGNYESASEAFASIAYDETTPTALRWEALVRYGLVLSAAGETTKSREAFKTALVTYSEEPEAVRFLTYAVTAGVAGKIWLDFKAEFEDLLQTAEVVSTEDIGNVEYGVKIVYLERGEIELKAIWKPIVSQTPPRESYQAEIAAYELDKILELDMVPPTVGRNIEGRPGAIQLWVHGCKVYRDVEGQTPKTPEWSRELSRVKTFDNLIGNRDRHAVQILIDPTWGIVLIDHSRAFSSEEDLEDPPMQFDRRLIEKLRTLSKIGLQARLEGILVKKDIENILKRRDRLLALVEQLVAEKGEAAVFF
jgi:tetratricopeptide (TPR) repeat protein